MAKGAVRTAIALTLAMPAAAQDFTPGRPGATDSPVAVAPGRFQLETELAGFGSEQGERSFSVLSTVFRYGLGGGFDAEVGVSPFLFEGRVQGFGDTMIRVRKQFTGFDDGPAFALIGYLTIPTSSNGLGADKVDGGLTATGSTKFSEGFGLTATGTIGTLHSDSGTQAQFAGALSLDHELSESSAAFLEVFAEHAEGETPTSFSFGLTHLVNSETQIDISSDIGLNGPAEDFRIAIGFAHRF
ncbi:transporter [Sandaracinobacteroides hominis]|uniref:transporter n=1 Tax=Sandaracinobacteroides hominis TaxID=2780086 RepID=UPI0018F3D581|nr:transporter [Sandaracinobacteroides hominis]